MENILLNSMSNFTGFEFNETQSLLENLAGNDGLACLAQSGINKTNHPFYGDKFCEPIWDGTHCWPATLSNQKAHVLCSDLFRGKFTFDKTLTAFKSCSEEGRWFRGGYTNYSSCTNHINHTLLASLKSQGLLGISGAIEALIPYVLLVGSIFSVVSLVLAICAYLYLRALYSERLKILLQMMLALLLKSAVWIFIVVPDTFPNIVDYRNWVWVSKLIIMGYLYSQLVIVFWMVALGHYFNSKLSANQLRFTIPKVQYFTFSWATPGVIVACWATAMTLTDGDSAYWSQFTQSRLFLIITLPMLVAFLANLAYLVNMFWAISVRHQLMNNPSHLIQIRRAKMDAVTLCSVVGINYLVQLCNPLGKNTEEHHLFMAVSNSVQGGIVAVVGCFFYTDVRKGLLRKLSRSSRRTSQVQIAHFQ